ncbi:hypothetical protein DFJ73DRAFT_960662 [Zopfochytrium polystomum]|nr:hypothetical protein DFJ73DRAFT_960662 [Zopfochytrium polystomum]
MPFTELWDQWRELEHTCGESVQLMDRLGDFVRRRGEIEAEYARSLQRLYRPLKEEIQRRVADRKTAAARQKAIIGSTVFQAWHQLVNEAEHVSSVHQSLSDKLEAEVRRPVRVRAQEAEARLKQRFDEIRRAGAELQKDVANLEKLREKYEADKRSMEQAKAAVDRAVKAAKKIEDAADARLEADKKALAAAESMEEYQKAMAATNKSKNKFFKTTLPSILENIQTDDESLRTEPVRAALAKYYDLVAGAGRSTAQALEATNAVFAAVSAAADSEHTVRLLRSPAAGGGGGVGDAVGAAVPADFRFEEKADLSDFLGSKRNAASSSPTKAFEADDDEDESIVRLGGKKGRKLAVDRIKVLEREGQDAERRIQALDSLLAVYEQKSAKDPRHVQRLRMQRQSLDVRATNAALRRHRLLAFVASIDNQPPPPLPAHLRGRTIASPSIDDSLIAASADDLVAAAATGSSQPPESMTVTAPASEWVVVAPPQTMTAGAVVDVDAWGPPRAGPAAASSSSTTTGLDPLPTTTTTTSQQWPAVGGGGGGGADLLFLLDDDPAPLPRPFGGPRSAASRPDDCFRAISGETTPPTLPTATPPQPSTAAAPAADDVDWGPMQASPVVRASGCNDDDEVPAGAALLLPSQHPPSESPSSSSSSPCPAFLQPQWPSLLPSSLSSAAAATATGMSPPPGQSTTTTSSSTLAGRRGTVQRARYDFSAAPRSLELDVAAGEEVEVLEEMDEGWWRVRSVGTGAVGIVPSTFFL